MSLNLLINSPRQELKNCMNFKANDQKIKIRFYERADKFIYFIKV